MSNPTIFIQRNDVDLHVILDGTFRAGENGARGRYGEPEQPDREDAVEDITAAICDEPPGECGSSFRNGDVIELTLPEKERAEEALLAWYREQFAEV